MEWGASFGDPLKFYSLSMEAKSALLGTWVASAQEAKKKQKVKAKKLPAGLSLFDKPSWE